MIESNLLRRALVGLMIFATMVILGVVLAAGGDQGARRTPAGHLTAMRVASDSRSRRRDPSAVSSRPPIARVRKPRPAGRPNPL